jgi:hypothetical protein
MIKFNKRSAIKALGLDLNKNDEYNCFNDIMLDYNFDDEIIAIVYWDVPRSPRGLVHKEQFKLGKYLLEQIIIYRRN